MAQTGKCFLCAAPSNGKMGESRERCDSCARMNNGRAQNKWRAANRDQVNSTQNAWRSKNRVRLNANKTAWAKANASLVREVRRRHQLKKQYGMTQADFERMLSAQGGCCAICESSNPSAKNWHIDHDHQTGAVRAILCNLCNVGLGSFRDNPRLLLAAESYLQKHSKSSLSPILKLALKGA